MIAYPVPWPIDPRTGRAMLTKEIDINVVSSTKSGGQATSGIEQLVASPGARWEGKLTMPSMLPQALLVWRGFVASLQGRLGTFLLPAFEYGRQPWPVVGGVAQSPDIAPSVISVTAAAAPINATQLTLGIVEAGPILPGHRFSIGGHLYEIQQAVATAPATVVVAIRPWLRAAVAGGTLVEFAYPTCTVRFKADNEGALRFTSHRTAIPVFSFVEAGF